MLISILSLLLAGAQEVPPVALEILEGEPCRVRADGAVIAATDLAAAARDWSAAGKRVRISGFLSTPTQCLDAISKALKAGDDEPLRLVVLATDEADGSKSCTVRHGGLSLTTQGVGFMAPKWAAQGRTVEITGDPATPYKCLGGVMFELQKAGVKATLNMPNAEAPPQ